MMSFIKPNVSSNIRRPRYLSSGVWLIVSWLKSNMTIFYVYQSHTQFRQACLECFKYSKVQIFGNLPADMKWGGTPGLTRLTWLQTCFFKWSIRPKSFGHTIHGAFLSRVNVSGWSLRMCSTPCLKKSWCFKCTETMLLYIKVYLFKIIFILESYLVIFSGKWPAWGLLFGT